MASELKFLVPWGHIAAKAWGSSTGHPVLCLHGWLDNANTFDKLIPLLPKDCYYVAIDLGGHGLSSHRPAGFPYHFLDYINDVYRIATAQKWGRFTLMGHSFGATVAGMFSCLFPELVHKLILLESLGFYPAPKAFERRPRLRREKKSSCQITSGDDISNLEECEKLLKSRRETIKAVLNIEANQTPKVRSPEEALRRLLEANRNLTEESGKILLQRGATEVPGGLVYNRDLRVLVQSPLSDSLDQNLTFLRKIQADVLLVVAQDGIFASNRDIFATHLLKEFLEAYNSHLKERFECAEVTGNHFVHLNEPEVVAGIVTKFLNKVPSPRANL